MNLRTFANSENIVTDDMPLKCHWHFPLNCPVMHRSCQGSIVVKSNKLLKE